MTENSGEKTMTFWEHLDELRVRVRRALIAFILTSVAAWYAREYVLAVLVYPFQKAWLQQNLPGSPQLHFAAPSDAFVAYVKQSMIAGAVFAAPFIFWQLWAFIAPGLYAKEKKTALLFVVFIHAIVCDGWRIRLDRGVSYRVRLSAESFWFGGRR